MSNDVPQDPDPAKKIREKVFSAAAETIDFNTVPICLFRDRQLFADRSGVLLQIGAARFLITAAHLDKDGRMLKDAMDHGYLPCIVMPEKHLHPVPILSERCVSDQSTSEGFLSTTNPDEDITVVRLSDQTVTQLGEHYRFLRLSDLISQNDPAHKAALYLINGYPTDMIKQEPDAKRSDVWRYLTVRYSDDLANVSRYDPNLHIILEYEKRSHNKEGKTVHPLGMSGCGIWYVADYFTLPQSSLKLAGIQTAWHPKHEYAKGTWIDLVLYIIWRYHPDCRNVMGLHGIRF